MVDNSSQLTINKRIDLTEQLVTTQKFLKQVEPNGNTKELGAKSIVSIPVKYIFSQLHHLRPESEHGEKITLSTIFFSNKRTIFYIDIDNLDLDFCSA